MAKIMGVDTDKVSEEVIDRYLGEAGIACDGRLNRKIRVLAKHFASRKQEEGDSYEEVVCTTCGGDSPASLPCCPFCGDSDEVADTPKVKGAPVEDQEDESEVEQEPPAPSDSPPGSDDEQESEPEPEALKPRSRSKAGKPDKAKKAKPSKKVTEDVIDEPTTIAKVDKAFDEGDLDACVEEAKRYMASATMEAYRVGKVLKHIHDNNLYLLRKGEKGPMHLSFKAFVRAEFQISHQQAYNLMAVTEHFTEDEVNRLGVSKLKLALQVPKEMRDDLLSDAEDGASMSQLSERANALLNKAEKPKKQLKSDGGLTAILAMGILEAPMYCAPKAPGKVGAPTKPARTLKDAPFCVFKLENDVTATIHIDHNDDGELVATLTFRKGEEVV